MSKFEREKLIHKYVTSLDNGDMDGVAEVLDAALYDSELDRIITEINLVYHEEEGLPSNIIDLQTIRKLREKTCNGGSMRSLI